MIMQFVDNSDEGKSRLQIIESLLPKKNIDSDDS